MRKIFIQEPDSEIWKKWIRDCQEETQKVIGAFDRGEKPIISDLYKRKAIKNTYFASKNAPFYGRCAYCETPIADTQYIQIEHFRPKAGIKNENGNVVNLKNSSGLETDIPHHGYYWLTYDWHNLVPSCAICNQPKSTIFPVIGNHAQSVGEEVNESPLLINPISDLDEDNPENHLAVDFETGIMQPVNDSPRGRACINLFNLNGRDQILKARKTQQEFIQYRLLKFREICGDIANPEKPQNVCFEAIVKNCDYFIDVFKGKEAYTAASLSVLSKYSISWFQKQRQIFQELLSKIES